MMTFLSIFILISFITSSYQDLPTTGLKNRGIPSINGTDVTSNRHCFIKKPETVRGMEDNWFITFGQQGVYNRISYKMEGWGDTAKLQPNAPKPPPEASHKFCWDVQMKTPKGQITELDQTRNTCFYEKYIASENCSLSTTSMDFIGAFKHWGSFDVVKYRKDAQNPQKEYMLVYVCLLGTDDFFLGLTPTDFETPLDKTIKAEILAEVKKMGFQDDKIIYDADSDLAIEKVTIGICPEEGVYDKMTQMVEKFKSKFSV